VISWNSNLCGTKAKRNEEPNVTKAANKCYSFLARLNETCLDKNFFICPAELLLSSSLRRTLQGSVRYWTFGKIHFNFHVSFIRAVAEKKITTVA
jgi:hypothetical protein